MLAGWVELAIEERRRVTSPSEQSRRVDSGGDASADGATADEILANVRIVQANIKSLSTTTVSKRQDDHGTLGP
jgi:hypothetical protein